MGRSTESPAVVHHTGLEWTGGATRVARLLAGGMAVSGLPVRLTCEVAESGVHREESPHAFASSVVTPDGFGPALAPGETAHIHCTGDWPGLLGAIPQRTQMVMTLHDCELFTGGCPYPLDCQGLEAQCVAPCPRAFADSDRVRHRKYQSLHRLDPVLIVPSRWLARLAKSHLHRPVTVIPNGIPWPDHPMSRHEARARLGILPAARVAVFAAHGGLGAAYKSGGDWRGLWGAIKARVPGALCFAVGGDTEGREGDLVIWPYVERERLALLMAAADALLYPTLADNHSLVILEAMAQGLAVVAHAVGGVPEQVGHDETGLLVEPGDRAAFIEAAAALLADPARCRQLGTNAFVSGRRRFTAQRMIADYRKVYRQLGKPRPAQGEP
ncbi:glycosyltransferase [Pseudodesulfovibrio pelocollis]|uniref:glycosyltransferase n=1 Tax=Pseudodesulfovibrio pelocollis TaxID=3051432 RepID=UPI00255B3D24|nr:glycosyltransferase [Pseudodesulfovibrio sp. SB368]